MTRDSFRMWLTLRALVAGAFLAGASDAFAVEAIGVLNDTGQSTCYDTNYNAVPCDESTTGDSSPLLRQDARYGRDAAAAMGRLTKTGGGDAGFDFTRVCMNGADEGQGDCPSPPPLPADLEHPQPNDWACVRDNVTGLTWTLGSTTQLTWADASSTEDGSYIQSTNASSRCGLSAGWRLPARREGYQLLNVQRQIPAVDPAYFPILANPSSVSRAVWTADATAWHSVFQWTLIFSQAAILGGTQCRELADVWPCGSYPPGVSAWKMGVLLVNGSWNQPPAPEPPEGKSVKGDGRWQIRDDGLTVTDTATGLTWDRCTWGQIGSTCDGAPTIYYDWNEAMQAARAANELRYKGIYDWRVPSVRELETLVKIDSSPAIDTAVFPNTLVSDNHSYYYSSSQNEYVPDWAAGVWVVEFSEGTVSEVDKLNCMIDEYPNIGPVRLVHGGSQLEAFDGVSDRLFWSDFDGAPPVPAH